MAFFKARATASFFFLKKYIRKKEKKKAQCLYTHRAPKSPSLPILSRKGGKFFKFL